MEKEKTLTEALGLDEEWSVLNKHRLGKDFDNQETISSVILQAIKRIKHEEFGETTDEITSYEKKLMLTGLHLSTLINKRTSPFEILGTIFGGALKPGTPLDFNPGETGKGSDTDEPQN